MPIYEYQCSSCQHQFELMQKIGEAAQTHCPACNKDAAIRLVSAAGFQLKGTGWYVTDFKNKGEPKAATTTAAETTDKKAEQKSTPSSADNKTSTTKGDNH